MAAAGGARQRRGAEPVGEREASGESSTGERCQDAQNEFKVDFTECRFNTDLRATALDQILRYPYSWRTVCLSPLTLLPCKESSETDSISRNKVCSRFYFR